MNLKATILILFTLLFVVVTAQDLSTFNRFDSIAEANFQKSDYKKATEYSKKALAIAKELPNDSLIIEQLTRLSYAADYLGYYNLCQEYNFELLELYQKNGDREGEASALNDIGIVHYYKEEYKSALNYAFKSLEIYEELKDTSGISMCYNNIANNQTDDENLQTGLDYYFKALELNRSSDDFEGIVMCLGNIGETYYAMKEYEKTGGYYRDAVNIASKNKVDDWYLLTPYLGLAQYFIDNSQLDSALYCVNKVYAISIENGFRAEKAQTYHMFSIIYDKKDSQKEALEYYKKFKSLEDSIYKDQNNSRIAELNAKYELSEKDNQIMLQQVNLDKEREIISRNRIVITLMVIAVLIVLAALFYIVRENKKRKKINKLLNEKNDVIEEKNRNITESILYARKIQNAILPHIEHVKNSFPESFILYTPKDIVSGDFYWFDNSNDVSIIAAVDCTGHGVPGAFMSMMANDLLNQIVSDEHIEHPSIALNLLDKRVKQNLRQNDDSSEGRDGLDIALCAFHHEKRILEYAGAKNDLYLIRNGEIIIYKANRYSIGGTLTGKTFEGVNIEIKENDIVYLFTDGYVDQFGGERDKKFSYKRFRNLLIEISTLEMEEQNKRLQTVFEEWKGDNEQLDDICVIGIKF